MKKQFNTSALRKLDLNKKTIAFLSLSDSEMKMLAGGNALNFGTVPALPEDNNPTVNTSKMQSCTLGPTRPFTFPD